MYFSLYGNLIVVLFAALVGILQYKFIRPKLNYIFLYVCVSSVTQLAITLFYFAGFKRNLPALHFYLLFEFALISLFYLRHLDNYINRKWIYFISSVFIIYSVINSIFIQNITDYPNIPRAIEALILIVFSLIYFNKVLIEAKISALTKEPLIWINLAVLIYFSGNFVYHIMFNMILEYSRETARMIGILFTLLNIIYYILIAIGFWKAGAADNLLNKQQRTKS